MTRPLNNTLFICLWLAVLAGLAANIYADIDLDAKAAQTRLELVQAILNQELVK